ncbi:titin homolog [Ptychodera flava]|uniref:titin homolog n=1 Tax=Ptychodera flava TaxID=63121 RepID=UPI00396A2253
MEEQIENTNYFKSGVDYLLEAKLATSKSAEAQKKLEGVQTELLRSQQEVNHLLDKLAEMNKEKTDMISSNVHHELLKISDQRAKDAEMRSQQLEYEVRQLKNQLQASPKKTVSFAKHVTKPSSPSTTVQNVAKKPPTTGLSQTKESSFQYKIFSTDSVLKSMALSREKGKEKIEVPGTFQLPEVSSLKSSGNISADPAEFKEAPLMVSAASDSDSDWSSSGAEDDNKREVQFSPPAKKPKPMSRKSITPERKPIIDQSGRRPPIAPKPSLPPKPVSTTPMKMNLKSVEEKPISFDDQVKAPSLATKRRLSGPKGRARPSKFRRKNVSMET